MDDAARKGAGAPRPEFIPHADGNEPAGVPALAGIRRNFRRPWVPVPGRDSSRPVPARADNKRESGLSESARGLYNGSSIATGCRKKKPVHPRE